MNKRKRKATCYQHYQQENMTSCRSKTLLCDHPILAEKKTERRRNSFCYFQSSLCAVHVQIKPPSSTKTEPIDIFGH